MEWRIGVDVMKKWKIFPAAIPTELCGPFSACGRKKLGAN
jgi:hypothetical protein